MSLPAKTNVFNFRPDLKLRAQLTKTVKAAWEPGLPGPSTGEPVPAALAQAGQAL